MDKETEKKISALNPAFKKKITELFDNLNESISFLYEAAIKDEKTGLYNNKFFDNILDMEIEKAKRGQGNLSLAILDIDDFKKINEKHGHLKADEFLKRLADVLKKELRKSDIAARFGGEEFFLLLPETDIEKAKKMISRLKDSINLDKILKKNKITVSGGLTQFKSQDNKKKFMERADKAMFKAKREGKNRFEVSE